MGTDHTLRKILGEISKNKSELEKVGPEDELTGQAAQKKPIKNVENFFSEDNLKNREQQSNNTPPPPEVPNLETPHPSLIPPSQEGVPKENEINPSGYVSLAHLPEEVREELLRKKDKYEFRSVFDFKDFILMFREEFDDHQKGALDSIVGVCDSIEVGCKCKRGSRLKIAEDYYVQFIDQNQGSGLIEKFKTLLNTDRIKFYTKDRLFLER